MQLGQILLESNLVKPKQLAAALEYAASKRMFLGRALRLLGTVEEDNVTKALQVQQLVKKGLPVSEAMEILTQAINESTTIEKVTKRRNLKLTVSHKKTIEVQPLEDKDESPEDLVKSGDEHLRNDELVSAQQKFSQALILLEGSLGKNNGDLAPLLVRLGNTFLAIQAFDKAASFYERALSLRMKIVEEYRDNVPLNVHMDLVQTFESLGDLYSAQHDESRAMWAFLSALDILEPLLPEQHVAYAMILRKLSVCAEIREAEPSITIGELLVAANLITNKNLEKALSMSKRSSIPLGIVLRENAICTDLEVQSALKAQFCIENRILPRPIAECLLLRAYRRNISFDQILEEADLLSSREENFEVYRLIAADLDQLISSESSDIGANPKLGDIAHRLGLLYQGVGDRIRAEFFFRRALSSWGMGTPSDFMVIGTYSSLAKLIIEQRRYEEAIQLLEKEMNYRRDTQGAEHAETLRTMEQLSAAHLAAGHANHALQLADEVLSTRKRLGETESALLKSIILKADSLTSLKNFDEALENYKAAMELAKPELAAPTATIAEINQKMGDLYAGQQLLTAAKASYSTALIILQTSKEPNSEAVETLKRKLKYLDQVKKYE